MDPHSDEASGAPRLPFADLAEIIAFAFTEVNRCFRRVKARGPFRKGGVVFHPARFQSAPLFHGARRRVNLIEKVLATFNGDPVT